MVGDGLVGGAGLTPSHWGGRGSLCPDPSPLSGLSLAEALGSLESWPLHGASLCVWLRRHPSHCPFLVFGHSREGSSPWAPSPPGSALPGWHLHAQTQSQARSVSGQNRVRDHHAGCCPGQWAEGNP